ncbi:MAG: c-type cytochrome biogenesis protein CcmI [Pseudomonadales bacterium]|nr:c-type cytochrome biogenesis protein CcmI [Pseudomonadales bacterium]
MFWILTACLFVLALTFVLLPLWWRRKASSYESETLRKTANIALFHERSNELEADLATGDIDKPQYDRLMLELQQSLLADISEAEKEELAQARFEAGKSDVAKTESGKFGLTFAIPVILALLVPAAAYVMYERWGYIDEVSLMDLYQRTVNNPGDPQEAQELIVALGEAVQANEEQPWAWYFLAENFANIGMFNEAQIGYQRSAGLLDDSPDKALVLGRVALAMYVNADLEMTPEVEAVIAQARELNTNETSVLQLLAANAEQTEDWESAIEYWRLLIQQNPNSQQAQEMRRSIAMAQQRLAGESGEAMAGPVVQVRLRLAEGLSLDQNLRVFLAARNAEQEGMPPLAAVSLTVADLPAEIELDNSSAVGPFNLSSADSITVSALVSQRGSATPEAGDYRVESERLSLDEERISVELLISEQIQ